MDPALIKSPTTRVRCSQCQHVFTVELPDKPDISDLEGVAHPVEEPPPPRRRFQTRSLILLTLLLVVGIGIALWLYLPWPLKLESVPGGTTIELFHLVETRGYFIDNRQAGQLFVIEGRLRNEFPKPRRLVQLRAKLYTADGRAVQQLDFYAGNPLSARQLKSLPLADLLGSIQRRPTSQEPAKIVAAREEVSFVVPFGNLPDLSKLSDYSVEVLASQPA